MKRLAACIVLFTCSISDSFVLRPVGYTSKISHRSAGTHKQSTQCLETPTTIGLDKSLDRRLVVNVLSSALFFSLNPPVADGASTEDRLAERLNTNLVRRLALAGPLGASEADFPEWLAGDWDCTFSFARANFPLGRSFAEFKQLLAGSVRSPADSNSTDTKVSLRWNKGNARNRINEDKAYNLKNYYNGFSKSITIEGNNGPRTRNVAWMPILTQRGVYEKVNQAKWENENNFELSVKEIAPDLSTVGLTPLQGTVVSRSWSRSNERTFTISELFRIKRLSQGRVKMIETGTGDTEVISQYMLQQDGTVLGKHRVLVYLVPFPGPAGDLYADSEGKAVAIYDWNIRMVPAAL
jgi:hypothetical protein